MVVSVRKRQSSQRARHHILGDSLCKTTTTAICRDLMLEKAEEAPNLILPAVD